MQSFPPEVVQNIIIGQDRFAWEAPSFPRRERGSRWYIFMSLAAVFLVAYAVWTSNFLFAFFVLLAAILIILVGQQEPKAALVQIGDNGVVWDGRLFLFQDIDNFAIVYQPPYSKILYIEPKNPLVPRLRIPLEDQDPVAIRDHIKQYLREDLDIQAEHLSDTIARLLKI